MTLPALLFTIAAIGISETVYLIRTRIAKKRPACIIGAACHLVLESKYNKIFGIRNDVLGLSFYIATAVLTAFLVIGLEPLLWWERLTNIFILGGTLLSIYFIYLQWQVIRAWCFWCLISAGTVFLMALIVLMHNLQPSL